MVDGFALDVARRRFPGIATRQLAIVGKMPMDTLADLSADANFRGTVICAITVRTLVRWPLLEMLPELSRQPSETKTEGQRDYVDYFHKNRTANTDLDALLQAKVQSGAVVSNPSVGVKRIVQVAAWEHQLPSLTYVHQHLDRGGSAKFSSITTAQLAKNREHRFRAVRRGAELTRPQDPQAWLQLTESVEPLVRAIQGRGGQVVFVRFPISGEYWKQISRLYPKKKYWDRFAAQSSAVCIHFQDVPGMRGFDCPDLSHLDARDAPRFTDALLDELVRRGVLPAGEDRRGPRLRVAGAESG